MPQSTTTLTVLDGGLTPRNLAVEQDTVTSVMTPHHVIETMEAPVSTTNPLPVQSLFDGLTMTQTVITLSGGSGDAVLIAANPVRQFLLLMNIDTGRCWINFGGSAVINAGLPLEPAGLSGAQGGSMTWSARPPLQAIHGISTVTTRIVVLEGQ